MKFYKVHAAKLKNDKVIFIGEQFNEIGPDAFVQTSFEYIILSENVTIIRDHAFSNIKNCSVYIPASVEEIESLAFEGMGSFNVIYCIKGSCVYNRCNELGVPVNTEVATCISDAKRIKEDDENNKRIVAIKEANQKEAEKIRREALKEAERIKKEAEKEAEKIRSEAEKEAKRKRTQIDEEIAKPWKQDTNNSSNKTSAKEIDKLKKAEDTTEDNELHIQKTVISDIEKHNIDVADKGEDCEELFIEKFGLPPKMDEHSHMEDAWKEQISQLDTESIINNYDSNEYCEEYRYYCYIELKNRFLKDGLSIKSEDEGETITFNDANSIETENLDDESDNVQENDEIFVLLGMPPECSNKSELHEGWKMQIKLLATPELLGRYDSEEWNEEYRYLCYKELATRKDLKSVIDSQWY